MPREESLSTHACTRPHRTQARSPARLPARTHARPHARTRTQTHADALAHKLSACMHACMHARTHGTNSRTRAQDTDLRECVCARIKHRQEHTEDGRTWPCAGSPAAEGPAPDARTALALSGLIANFFFCPPPAYTASLSSPAPSTPLTPTRALVERALAGCLLVLALAGRMLLPVLRAWSTARALDGRMLPMWAVLCSCFPLAAVLEVCFQERHVTRPVPSRPSAALVSLQSPPLRQSPACKLGEFACAPAPRTQGSADKEGSPR